MLPHDTAPGQYAAVAEEGGFDVLATGEHVLFRRPLLNSFVSLSAAAARTERIRLMTALAVLPLYPAALAAKLASSLDYISGGRLDLGLGVGGEVPEEFAACGVDVAGRGARTDAAIEELLHHFDATEIVSAGEPAMLPKPVQQPAPPIWIGGRSDAALRRAARYGRGWLPYLMTPAQVAERALVLRASREEPIEITAVAFVSVGTEGRRAEQDGARFLSDLYGLDPSRVGRYVVGGELHVVTERLREFFDAGATGLILSLCAAGDAALAMTRYAATTVLPALKESTTTGMTNLGGR